MTSYIIVGDVHGCYDELLVLLERYGLGRQVVFVGDLIDKGPKPRQVLELAKAMGAQVVLGNHEEKHVRYHGHEATKKLTGKANPMRVSKDFLVTRKKLLKSSVDLFLYMKTLPTFVRLPEHNVVVLHGGLLPFTPPEKMKRDKICRVREIKVTDKGFRAASLDESRADPTLPFWTEFYTGDEHVVYGHAVRDFVRVDSTPLATCLGIDTGCVYGKTLSALLLPEFDVCRVHAQKVYYK